MTAERPNGGDRRGSGGQPGPFRPGLGLAFDLGLRLAISVVVGLGAGLLADGWLHSSPLFTLVGMVVGIGAAMYTIWDVARQGLKREG
jgi:ATP synthase protein I